MDGGRLDLAARILALTGSRRSATGLLAALAALAGSAASIEAARRGRPGAGERPGTAGPCGGRKRKDNVCTKDAECCTGVCDRSLGEKNNDGKGRCRCLPRGRQCQEDRNCCGSRRCIDGVCKRGGGGECSAATCASGCCQGGACMSGTDAAACGSGGGACAVCSGETPACQAGVCAARTWQGTTPMATGVQSPRGVREAANGLALYAAEATANRVAMWSRASVDGEWQPQTPIGDGTPGNASSQMISPAGIDLSADMRELYIADTDNNRIAMWTASSANTGWTAQAPLGSGQFSGPTGVTLSPNQLELYVADKGNNQVAVWTRTTIGGAWSASSLLGNGQGTANDQFDGPQDVALSPSGLELYVIEATNCRIAVWTRTTVGGAWSASSPLGNGQGTDNDQFGYPTGVVMSPDGLAMYISDWTNSRVEYWARPSIGGAWTAQPKLGRNSSGSANDQFANCGGLGLSPDGLEMYVADSGNQRIARWIYI